MDWCNIESDPGVFTELLEKVGVRGVEVEEVWDMDSKINHTVHGLIFLFKYTQPTAEEQANEIVIPEVPDLFFAKQMVTNACATQAILSVMMNVDTQKHPNVEIGPVLQQFKDFTTNMPADICGLAISNSPDVCTAHNSFARPEPLQSDGKRVATEKDDVFHFVGYIQHQGMIYMLDGLKPGPVLVGECENQDWLEVVMPAIRERTASMGEKEIRFALMAIVDSKLDALHRRLQELGEVTGDASVDVQRSELLLEVKHEEARRKRWQEENIRRRHNYIPFVYNLLKHLAAQGRLQQLLEDASNEENARREAESSKQASSSSVSSS